MTRQPARVLEESDLRDLLIHTHSMRHPHRNYVLILLSYKAGLRACEMAGLTWPMVLLTSHKVGFSLVLPGSITKGGRLRTVPIHPELRRGLVRLHTTYGFPASGPVIRSERQIHLPEPPHMSAGSIVNWFTQIYADLGLKGCSSHSGRRTFITNAARALSQTGGSLRDVQELAGHRALTTTERYIQGDRAAQHKLVSLI